MPTSRNSESYFMVNSYLITFSNGNTNRSTFVSHPPMRINMWTRRSLIIHSTVLHTFRQNPEIATDVSRSRFYAHLRCACRN